MSKHTMTAPTLSSALLSSPEARALPPAAEIIIADLCALLADLGRGGGLQNGSVYDTAQIVRLAPPEQGCEQAVEWLLSQQHPDGGWDNPEVLRARDTPTLASVLALHVRGTDERSRQAVARGLEFLRAQAPHWTELPDDLLVGVELTLPQLLEDAESLGLDVPKAQYSALLAMGARRREKLSRMKIMRGTPPVHSWEGWGKEADAALLDGSGGVGLSPAATAAWLQAAEGRPGLEQARASARNYLRRAEEGADVGLPGVVPPSWPINLMEQQWGLLALWTAGVLNHPRLADQVAPHLEVLGRAFSSEKDFPMPGIGFTEHFMPDGDCTAVTVGLLTAAGRPVNSEALKAYEREGHFLTYPFESNASLTTTAHAVMALNLLGRDTSRWVDGMLQLQSADGRWMLDKWQTSWLYVTSHVMLAIADATRLRRSITTLVEHQKADGGWGHGEESTMLETAFAVVALHGLSGQGVEEQAIREALHRANRFMRYSYRPFHVDRKPTWIAKALYCPFRMDRAFVLSAMLMLALSED